ncbi:MAG: type II toxin-antitoxin system RelE/ParE family toxin [Defluviitaleaceae bacterium]|nr:type II toxin-antitoxin system RelE/ParE family toxin [Defluviitaleaceae bacterium]
MEIKYSKQSVKAINRMDSARKRLIKEAIERLPKGDTKQIKSSAITVYRLRVGGWRVLYSMDADTIYVEKIVPRGDFYKGV